MFHIINLLKFSVQSPSHSPLDSHPRLQQRKNSDKEIRIYITLKRVYPETTVSNVYKHVLRGPNSVTIDIDLLKPHSTAIFTLVLTLKHSTEITRQLQSVRNEFAYDNTGLTSSFSWRWRLSAFKATIVFSSEHCSCQKYKHHHHHHLYGLNFYLKKQETKQTDLQSHRSIS